MNEARSTSLSSGSARSIGRLALAPHLLILRTLELLHDTTVLESKASTHIGVLKQCIFKMTVYAGNARC